MLINSQHPDGNNTFPYNNSLTYAISGWDGIATSIAEYMSKSQSTNSFSAYPNPVATELTLNKVSDVAIYDMTGKRIKVLRDVIKIDMSDLKSGTYLIMNTEGEKIKVVVD